MELHYIMTVQNPGVANGFVTATLSGVYSAMPGQSRADVYRDIYSSVVEQIGGKPNVMFFSLEPNILAGA